MQAHSQCPPPPHCCQCGLCSVRSCIHLDSNNGRPCHFRAIQMSNTSACRPACCLTRTAWTPTTGNRSRTPHSQRRPCPAQTTQLLLSYARWACCKYPKLLKLCPSHWSTLRWQGGGPPRLQNVIADLIASLASCPCWLPSSLLFLAASAFPTRSFGCSAP